MPNIHPYSPAESTFRPSNEGLSGWETAARRIGPMYREAARELEQAGELQARVNKQKLWPWDIIALQESRASGPSLKVKPGKDLFNKERAGRAEQPMRDHNQVNKGGAALAQLVDTFVPQEKAQMIDAMTGQIIGNDPNVTVLFPGANAYGPTGTGGVARTAYGPTVETRDGIIPRGVPPDSIFREQLIEPAGAAVRPMPSPGPANETPEAAALRYKESLKPVEHGTRAPEGPMSPEEAFPGAKFNNTDTWFEWLGDMLGTYIKPTGEMESSSYDEGIYQ